MSTSLFTWIQLCCLPVQTADTLTPSGYFLPFSENLQTTASKYARTEFVLKDTLDQTTLLSFGNLPVIVSPLSDSSFQISIFANNPFTDNDELLLQYSLHSDTCLYSLALDSIAETDYSKLLHDKRTPIYNNQYTYANAIMYLQTLNANHFAAFLAGLNKEKSDSKLRWFLPLFYSMGLITTEDIRTTKPVGKRHIQNRRKYKPE